MRKETTTRQKIKDRRKQELLDASLKLFAIKGIDNVTMDDIADEVGCSHGLVYHYFRNKNDIFENLTNESKKIFGEHILELSKTIDNPQLLFEEINNFFLDSIKESLTKTYYLFMFFTIPFNQKQKSTNKIKFSDITKYTIKKIKEAQDQGIIIEGDPKTIYFTYVNFILGTLYAKIRDPKKDLQIDKSVIISLFRKR